jgi:MSHA biogenesis protein MshQ
VTGLGTLNNGVANDGLATYSFATGETSVNLALTHTNVATITIGVADNATGTSLLTKTPANELANSITFNGGGFTITDAAGVAVTNLTQIAGQVSPTYYLKATNALCANAFNNVARSVDMAFECVDPTSCLAPVVSITNASTNAVTSLPTGVPFGTNPAVATYAAVSLNFNASSLAPFKINYPDVGNLTLYFRYTPSSLLSESNTFVVKPAGFLLSNIKQSACFPPPPATTCTPVSNPGALDAQGMAFVKAGEAFTVSVTAVNAVGVATPNYGHEVNPESVVLTSALVTGLGLSHAPPVIGSFGPFINGIATGSAFRWDEVGIITMTPSVGDADYLGVGDVTGTPSGNVGRFKLGKFDLQNVTLDDRSDLCQGGTLITDGVTPCSTFTYMGEEVDAGFTLVPLSLSGVPLQNYVDDTVTPGNDFAKLDPSVYLNLNLAAVDTATAATPYYLTSRFSVTPAMTVTCATTPCFQRPGGVGSQAQADVTVPLIFSRGNTPDGAYAAVQIGIAPKDADNALVEGVFVTTPGLCNSTIVADCYDLDTDAVLGDDHALLAATEFRFGRSKISNAHGSELLPLLMPIVAEYWDLNSSSFLTSVDDNISLVTVALGNYLGNLVVGDTTLTVPTIVNGIGQIGLSKPGLNKHGSVDVTVTAPAYLPGTARAAFGVYKGSNEFIYQREAY